MKPTEEIRGRVDLIQLVGEYVKLRKAGVNYKGLCPFHQEKTPSFNVHSEKQIFHCFGCGVGGDAFKFVMMIDNVSFPEAVERLAEKAGMRLPEHWRQGHDDAEARERSGLQKMHEAAAHFFAVQLGSTAEGRAARAYMEDRGLVGKAIAEFRLGYSPADGKALAKHLAGAGFTPDLMATAGLVIPGRDGRQPLDRFRGRVIFPIENDGGKVVAFAGRALGDEQPKYLNSPETPLYTKSRILYHLHQAGLEIRKQDCAVLVEGYMDCIALASNGVTQVVASCGTSLTASQVRLLGRFTRRVVVNFDPDSAGIAATERSLGLLLEEGFEVRVLTLPGGLDPDAFVRKHGGAAYHELLAKAPAYLDYLTDRAAATNDMATPEGKVRAANAVLPYLARVSNALLRDEMAGRLAERLRLDRRLLRDELRRAAQTKSPEMQAQPEIATLQASVAEKELLRAFLTDAALAGELLPPLMDEGLCEGLPTAGLFKKILAEYAQGANVDLDHLDESLSPEERRCLFEVRFSPGPEPDRGLAVSSYQALRRRKMEQDRASLQTAIERAERESDAEALKRLLKAKVELARNMAHLRQA